MIPLESDSARQAIPTLRGYSYQIWQSLLHWLELRENQQIYLEGAEDVDVLGPNDAEVVQVKETAESGSVTLRSEDILEAIENFWQHQKTNPGVEIYFRFLTTSDRGQERPAIIPKKRGLDIWDFCRKPKTDNKPLRKHLVAQQTTLSEDLREFIQKAKDADLRRKLLSRIEWDTGKKTQPYIEETVRRKVVEYGDRVYNLPPAESEKVTSHLLRFVWEVVRRKENRWLTKDDFLTEFQTATTSRITLHELQNLKRAASSTSELLSALSVESVSSSISQNETAILEHFTSPDTGKFAARIELTSGLYDTLNETNSLILTGSTGAGKSQLAYKIAATSGLEGNEWRKIDLRDASPEQIKSRLDYAARFLENADESFDCLIDDLNFDDRPSFYENALGRLLFTVRRRGGRIIITSQHELPVRLANLYNISPKSFIPVPSLEEVDIADLLIRHGCPSGHKLRAWSRLIFLQLRGNPLLTHAHVRYLASEGWTAAPSAEDLTTLTAEIKNIRQEFRRNLRHQLPEVERQLLYRLSIFTGRFKRRQALEIGAQAPALGSTGDAFDALVGPWIEPVDEIFYRLSPLLDGASSEVFTQDETKRLHGTAANSFLESVIGVLELNGLLFHGLMGEAQLPLAAAAMSVFGAERSGWEEIAQFTGWFAHLRINGDELLFPNDRLVNFLLRRLQYKVMSVLDSQKALKIALLIERELNEWDGIGIYPGGKEALKYNFLNDVIFDLNIPFPVKKIVEWVLEAVAAAQSPDSFFPENTEFKNPLTDVLKFLSGATMYVRATVGRCRNEMSVIELLKGFDESEAETAKDVWQTFETDTMAATTLVDSVWLAESRKEESTRDWTKCLQILEQIIEIAQRRSATALAVAAYKGKAIIWEEYLKDPAEALKILEEGETAIGDDHVALQDYRAKTLFLEKKYEEALTIWRQILPEVATDRNAARTFSYRDAEICAAQLGDWHEASELALRGEEAARLPWFDTSSLSEINVNTVGETMAVGFRADYAFALWKLGEKKSAVEEFSRVLNSFSELPDPEGDIRVLMLHKRVGYAIAWFSKSLEGVTDFEEPAAGFFSNPESNEEVKKTPLEPLKNYLYLLARVEYKLQSGNSVLRRLEEEISKLPNDDTHLGYADLAIRHALKKSDVVKLVPQFLDYSDSLKNLASEKENIGWHEIDILKQLTFAALMIFTSRGQQHLLPLDEWDKDIAANTDENSRTAFSDWIKLIKELLAADRSQLVKDLMQTNEPDRRVLAALILSAMNKIQCETRFYANVILLTADFSGSWSRETEDIIEFWVNNSWKRIAEKESFSLQTPRISAPAIIAACEDKSKKGLAKASNILLAAKDGVQLKVSSEIINQLNSIV
jgi:tetratricopeptide (TPR) repeat protein